jgi:nicotinamidase-related amidase
MNTALVLIDIQQGFLEATWGERNNPGFEANIRFLLKYWRENQKPIFHVQHLSQEPDSPLRPNRPGVQFMECAEPKGDEPVISKNVHSAFIQTQLEKELRREGINELVLVGLTSDHCVSTTARMGADLGFNITIPADAVATFGRYDVRNDKMYSADEVQAVSLASLHREFATISMTQQVLSKGILK